MFGSNFTLKLLIDVIREVKPSTVGLGAHHYVQLAESDVLGQVGVVHKLRWQNIHGILI